MKRVMSLIEEEGYPSQESRRYTGRIIAFCLLFFALFMTIIVQTRVESFPRGDVVRLSAESSEALDEDEYGEASLLLREVGDDGHHAETAEVTTNEQETMMTKETVRDQTMTIEEKEAITTSSSDHSSPPNSNDWFTATCDTPMKHRYIKHQNRTLFLLSTRRRVRPSWFSRYGSKLNRTLNGTLTILRNVTVPTPPVLRPWCRDEETGTYRLFAEHNQLQRRTIVGAKRCLANKHILFVGNSVVRYQFLSLVRMLTTGEWETCPELNPQDEEDGNEEDDDADHSAAESNNSVEVPQDDITAGDEAVEEVLKEDRKRCAFTFVRYHNGFNNMYSTLAARIKESDPSANYMCYCYRGKVQQDEIDPARPDLRVVLMFNRSREIHYFSKGDQFRLTYISNFYDLVRIDPRLPPMTSVPDAKWSKAQEDVCVPGDCENASRNSIEFTTRSALKELIPKLHPTHLFVQGWGVDDIGCALQDYQTECGSECKVWYLSHARSFQTSPTHTRQSCGIRVADEMSMTKKMPRYLYAADGVHFTRSVNQEFNHLIMSAMCSGPPVVGKRNP